MRVLITGARAPACLEWARLLAEAGCDVAVADSVALPLARFSSAAQQFFRLPEPCRSAHRYGQAVRDAAAAFQADIVVPTCEEAFYIAHQKHLIEQICAVFTPDFALMAQVHDKARFAQLTDALPIRTPLTFRVTNKHDLRRFTSDAANWVFKPVYSRFAARTLIQPDTRQLASVSPSASDPWVAQRFVNGREICSYSVLRSGTLVAHASYQPLFRVGRGSGVYFQPHHSKRIAEFLSAFGALTGFTGQVGFDFIDAGKNGLFVLECNPRATSGIHLFSSSRAKLASTLAPIAPSTRLDMESPPRMIAFAMLAFVVPRIRDLQTLRRFSKAWTRASDVMAAGSDRWIVASQLLSLGEIVVRSVSRLRPLLATATADIEWNGQELGPQP